MFREPYGYSPQTPYGQQPPQYGPNGAQPPYPPNYPPYGNDPRYQQPYGYDPRYPQQPPYGYNSQYRQPYSSQHGRVCRLDHTMLGRCFVDTTDKDASPEVKILRRNLANQLQLTAYSKTLSRPIPLTQEQNTPKWLDVTSAVKKLELLSWRTIKSQLHNMKPASQMVGKLVLIHDERGQLYREVFLIADYVHGQAFLLSLKDFRAFNWKVDQVIDFTEMMTDVLMRADDRNPLKSSAFDSFWNAIAGTSLSNYVKQMLNKFGTRESQTACVQLMNIFLQNGLPIDKFDALVEDVYKDIPKAAQSLLDSNHVVAVYQALQEGLIAETLLAKYKGRYAGTKDMTPEELIFSSGIARTLHCRMVDVPMHVKKILNSAPPDLLKRTSGSSDLELAFKLVDAYANNWKVTPIEDVQVITADEASSRFHETPVVEDAPYEQVPQAEVDANSTVPLSGVGAAHVIYRYLADRGIPEDKYEEVIDAIIDFDSGETVAARNDIAFMRANEYFASLDLEPVIDVPGGTPLDLGPVIEDDSPSYPQTREHPIYEVLHLQGIPEEDWDAVIARIVRCSPPSFANKSPLDIAYLNSASYFADEAVGRDSGGLTLTPLDPKDFDNTRVMGAIEKAAAECSQRVSTEQLHKSINASMEVLVREVQEASDAAQSLRKRIVTRDRSQVLYETQAIHNNMLGRVANAVSCAETQILQSTNNCSALPVMRQREFQRILSHTMVRDVQDLVSNSYIPWNDPLAADVTGYLAALSAKTDEMGQQVTAVIRDCQARLISMCSEHGR